MENAEILKGKKLLIVDDEPDILETLEEMLDMCMIDSAPDYETAVKFLEKNAYDAAILDIMGVRGFDLLDLTANKEIPTIMLTAHALNPEALVKSIKTGAQAYVPKERIIDIADYVADVLKTSKPGEKKHGRWFSRLKPFFDKKFGLGWKEKDKEFWKEFDKKYVPSKDELGKIM